MSVFTLYRPVCVGPELARWVWSSFLPLTWLASPGERPVIPVTLLICKTRMITGPNSGLFQIDLIFFGKLQVHRSIKQRVQRVPRCPWWPPVTTSPLQKSETSTAIHEPTWIRVHPPGADTLESLHQVTPGVAHSTGLEGVHRLVCVFLFLFFFFLFLR